MFATLHPVSLAAATVVALAYLAEVLALSLDRPSALDLVWAGANGVASLHGEPWRLLTYALLHTGPVHVGCNLIGILGFGARVETAGGAKGMMATLLAGVLVGGLVSAVGMTPDQHAVGVSGGVFSLLGFTLVMGLSGYPGVRLRWFWLDLATVVGFTLAVPSVDWRCHLGGFVAGLAVALAWPRPFHVPEDLRPAADGDPA